jgi:excisionase family DNA binding protein
MTDWLSPREVGTLLGVGPDRVSQLVREGVLKGIRTPGGQIRIRRDQVDELLAEPVEQESKAPPAPAAPLPLPGGPPPEPPRPSWKDLPPWEQRVHAAEAELQVLKLDGERQRLIGSHDEKQDARQRAAAEQAARVAEQERLRGLTALAMRDVPYLVPNEVRAKVARALELCVTSERYPATLAKEYTGSLLKAEVERLLRPWRAREARRERQKREAAERPSIITWAVYRARHKAPSDWDWNTKEAFERDVRAVLQDEVTLGMAQDEADAIALDVLDEWLDE